MWHVGPRWMQGRRCSPPSGFQLHGRCSTFKWLLTKFFPPLPSSPFPTVRPEVGRAGPVPSTVVASSSQHCRGGGGKAHGLPLPSPTGHVNRLVPWAFPNPPGFCSLGQIGRFQGPQLYLLDAFGICRQKELQGRRPAR